MNPMFRTVLAAVCALSMSVATAADGVDESAGFLTDYSLLQPSQAGQVGTFIYNAPNVAELLVGYDKVIIDQPAVGVAADSKVKSLKPDDAKAVADAFGEILAGEVSKGYTVVTDPGQGVLAIRTSLSNVYLKKKGRGLLGYTPVGLVVGTAKRALSSVMENINVMQVQIEAEVIDSVSGEVLAAVVAPMGSATDKKEYTSWEEVEAQVQLYAQRLKCNLDNARVAPDARTDCTAIVVPAPAES